MSAPIAHYSPIRRAGDFLITSGQLGMLDGDLVRGVGAQTDQAMANLTEVLASEGAGLADIVKTTIFLADIDHYAEVDEHYAAFFTEPAPARSAVAVAALPRLALVEIEAWALAPDA